MTDAKLTCKICRYWGRPDVGTRGTCRREPPRMQRGEGWATTGWPHTDETEWCGEFHHKDAHLSRCVEVMD